jgi:hypothetical protein
VAIHHCTPCWNCKVYCRFCTPCECKVFPYNHLEILGVDKLKPFIPEKEEKMYRLKNPCCDDFEKLTNPEEWVLCEKSERKIVIQNEYYLSKNISYTVTVFAEETNGFKDIIRLRELISKRINKLAEDVKSASITDLVDRISK